MKNDSNDRITLVGLVVPAQWDKNGEIVGIAISSYDEKDYPVLMDKVGRRLMAFMHEKILIIGKPIKKGNIEVIKVKRFNKNSI